MDASPLAVIAFGATATAATSLATVRSWRFKSDYGKRWPLLMFWLTATGYMAFFTILRISYWLHAGVELQVFYLQTLSGAATVISLAYIMVGVIIGKRAARVGMEVAGAAAVMVVTLIFGLGVTRPVTSAWGIEMLPVSVFARVSIAVVYVALPVALAGLAVWVSWRSSDHVLDRRLMWFAASVCLMYVPNAIKYVVIVGGPMGVALALTMAGGAMMGAHAYRPADNA